MNRLGEKYVRWILAHGAWVWALALLLFVPAAAHTVRLYAHLRSDFEQLLPRDSPSVKAVDELRARMEGLVYLGVLVDVGTAANLPAGERLLDDLATRVRAYPPELVAAARVGDKEERDFLEKHAPLYAELPDLVTIKTRIEARRDYEVSHALGTNLDDDEPPPPVDFSDLKAKYEARAGGGKTTEGRYSSAELRSTLLLIEVSHQGQSAGSHAAKEVLERVKADVAALGGPSKYAPGMSLGYTGDVAITVEETEALMADLSLSSVLVLFAVGAVLFYYFRWWTSLPVLLLPLLVATALAFGVAALPPFSVLELNSNTAFLGSIIVGNGINPGIILLARYVEERRRGLDVERALAIAVPQSMAGTVSASFAAAASYAALSVTQFQGFRQFGFVGGLGMVLAWSLTYLLVPPLLRWLDRAPSLPPVSEGTLGQATVGAVRRLRLPILIGAALLTALSLSTIRRFNNSNIETDFSRLRRADTWKNGEGYWGTKMNDLLGAYLTPLVVLTSDEAGARQAATAVRALADSPEGGGIIARVHTLDDVLPTGQAAKLAEVKQIRAALTPKLRARLDPEQKKQVERLLGPENLGPISLADLPRTFTTALRERDGSVGKAILVYPKPTAELWQGPKLVAFVDGLRAAVAQGQKGPVPRLAGGLPVTADIVRSMNTDGPRVTLAAFLGVVAVVLAIFRWRATTAWVLGALLLGVLWLAGLTGMLGIKINFANFIAFPITFGIGVDYAVNVISRYDQERDRGVLAAVASTGAAVGLCSATTIIGYSSLLVADNRALFLFGLLAVLGEFACLTAAVLVLPALLLSREGQPAGSTGAAQAP
jgi:hypothetical protein